MFNSADIALKGGTYAPSQRDVAKTQRQLHLFCCRCINVWQLCVQSVKVKDTPSGQKYLYVNFSLPSNLAFCSFLAEVSQLSLFQSAYPFLPMPKNFNFCMYNLKILYCSDIYIFSFLEKIKRKHGGKFDLRSVDPNGMNFFLDLGKMSSRESLDKIQGDSSCCTARCAVHVPYKIGLWFHLFKLIVNWLNDTLSLLCSLPTREKYFTMNSLSSADKLHWHISLKHSKFFIVTEKVISKTYLNKY